MRKTTKGSGVFAPIAAAVVVTVAVLLFVGGLLLAWLGDREESLLAVIAILYGLGGVAVVVGVIAAMLQRLRELRGGEEDDARKY